MGFEIAKHGRFNDGNVASPTLDLELSLPADQERTRLFGDFVMCVGIINCEIPQLGKFKRVFLGLRSPGAGRSETRGTYVF